MPLITRVCRCSYCSAVIKQAEADVAREILVCLDEEAFWEVTMRRSKP